MYILADCNNFYVSCERVFNRSLLGKPVVVLSNNDGCTIALSEEAKSIGITRGTPFFKCREILREHDGEIFSSNYTLYADISRRVMETLETFSPEMEIYSIDEAFLKITSFSGIEKYEFLKKIRDTVLKNTGMPISIGCGPTKTLAKAANFYSKKYSETKGIFIINKNIEPEILKKIPISKIWGIGPAYQKMLISYGINNAENFRSANPEWIRKKMTVCGLRTLKELNGISCISLEQSPPPKKAIVSSRSFGIPISKYSDLKEAVSEYSSRASEKLRKQSSTATYLTVFLSTNRFKDTPQYSNSITLKLSTDTNFTPDIITFAHKALEQIFRNGYFYKKTGIMLTGLKDSSCNQLTIIENPLENINKNKISNVMDNINKIYGQDTIKSASAGFTRNWSMRREFLSKRYTTRWDELPEVK